MALAAEMSIGMAEVYEVATFYHHFEVVRARRRGARPDGTGVRRAELRPGRCRRTAAQRLPALLGTADVRVIPAPCVGRCEQAPVAVVHQNPVPHADVRVGARMAVQAGATRIPSADDNGPFDLAALVAVQRDLGAAATLRSLRPMSGYQAYRAAWRLCAGGGARGRAGMRPSL